MKPVLKWIGSKFDIIEEIVKLFPPSFNSYWEPFVGSAALAIHCFETYPNKNIYLSDINNDLINFYLSLRYKSEDLLNLIEKISYSWNKLQDKHIKEKFYYTIRSGFNKNKTIDKKSALFYILNKTCFNGLVRYNRKGCFNAAYGKRDFVFEKDKLIEFNKFAISPYVEFSQGDFLKITPKPNDLVYFDPPYHPINNTSDFTRYNLNKWSYKNEIKLKEKMDELTNNNVYVILSNNNVEFIKDLFSNYNISAIEVNKRIAAKSSARKKTTEVLIKNF